MRAARTAMMGLVALAALGVVGGEARAQRATVHMEVDRTRVSTLDELSLTIEMEGTFDDWEAPDLSDFNVVNQGVTRVLSGGRSTVVRSFTLRPRRAGTFTIAPSELTRGGQVVARSDAIEVEVAAPQAAQPVTWEAARGAVRRADDPVFLHHTTPRERYWVGEPFPLMLEVYFEVDARLTSLERVEGATFDGLLVEDIGERDGNRRSERRRVGGRTMNVYTLSEQLATPVRAGRLLIDAVTVRGALRRGLIGSDRTFVSSSIPYWIEVKPLPERGRPATFDEGNVGRFELSATLSDDQGRVPERVRTGQRLILRVEVEGEGNLVTLEAPRIDGGEAFRVAPLPSSEREDRIVRDARGMRGRRSFQYLVTPLVPGRHEAPSVTLATFDPMAGRYVEAEAPRTTFEVTGDAIAADASARSTAGEDVRPIVDEAALDGAAPISWVRAPLYWGLLALPLLAFLFVEARHRLRRRAAADPLGRRARKAHQNAKKRLRAADRARRDGLVKDFYGQISRTLVGYLEERTNIPATGMTHDQIRAAAEAAGYPPDGVDIMIVEMENCDFARFAPSGSASEKMRETLERVEALLASLERVSPRRRA